MSDQVKNQILSRVNIKDLVSETVSLKQKSGVWVGLCPFHSEKTPSFAVYPESYYCFGCKESGDVISWVRKTQGLGFVDALRFLASRAGVDPSLIGKTPKQNHKAGLDYKALQRAQEIFTSNLSSPEGSHAREYLIKRGFSLESIERFGFGLATDSRSWLTERLESEGFDAEMLCEVSLTGKSEYGQLYDFFRSRLIVPIKDTYGRVIAFGGRSLGEELPKYKNSRETYLFDKSRVLFGWENARKSCRATKRPVVVCEGYMDVLMLWQFGLTEACACMGTALTSQHLKLISEASKEAVLLFDGDSAGTRASLAAVKTALSQPDLIIKVAELPDGLDPDEYVQRFGMASLEERLKYSEDVFSHFIKKRLQDPHGFEPLAILENEVFPLLSELKSNLQRDFLITKISQITQIPAKTLFEASMKAPPPSQLVSRQGPPSVKSSSAVTPAVENAFESNRNIHGDKAPRGNDEDRHLAKWEPASRDLEFLTLLFWLTPEQCDLARVSSAFSSYKALLSDEAAEVGAEMMAILATGNSPAKSGLGNLTALSAYGREDLFEKLESFKTKYRTEQGQESLEMLASTAGKIHKKDKVKMLKHQLTRATPEDALLILNEIKTLSSFL